MRAYYAYDGIRFDRRVQRPALDRLLRDRSLGRVFLIRRALSFVEAWVRARGVRAIHVAVERANRKALAFYRKVGFPGPERYLLTRRVARSRLRAIVGRRLRRAP
jgi:GNAT superfamily N-acetyltransferase